MLDDNVKSIYLDYNNNLWAGLNSGLAMCELNSPITFWNKQDGINGVIESVTKHQNNLYAATDKGLIKLNSTTNKFEKTELSEQIYDLKTYRKSLLIATRNNLYIKNGDANPSILLDKTVYYIYIDTINNYLYLSCDDAILCCTLSNNSFSIIKQYNIPGISRSITKNKEGFIIIGNETDGVYTIDSKGTIQVLNTKNGLPSNNNNFVFNANNKVAIGTDVGFYEWNYKNPKTVISSNEFNILNRKVIILNAKQINNSIWFTEVNPNNEIRAENINKISYSKNSYFENKNYLIRLSGIRAKSFYSDSSFVYLSTNQGLYCCDESNYTFKCQFSVIINKLIFGINTDTTYTLENYASKFQNYFHELPYKYNQLHITPTATSFYGDEKLQFSYYLEGRDTSYSDWRKNESIDYSDLKEGVYTFHIKAKDNIGSVSESVSITFTILPPWYRTTWAYIIYVILSITAFIISLRLYNKHLIADNLKLEKTIQDRTKTIVHQKQELESKNQEITDSINYAKRIQLSILPNVDEIKSAWKELFIFYQPKDIVSGDFYWFKKINETEFLLACADCTGHGVPGGFMSMICSSALKDASRISHKPSEILFHANNFVKDSLAQGNIEGGSKDGMEISLLLININSKQITYSGANRFLWILKKDALEIIDIKPTKGSIGSTTDYNFNYEEQVFVLSEGDQLYLSTDGFPDQFGGEEEKKFMTKNLKKLIINNAKSNIHDQHNIYKDTINAWMKNTDQVDDILVIGIKF